MKISHFALIFALVAAGHTVRAVPVNPTISLFETGHGMIELPNGVVVPLTGALAPDPGPGGLSGALTFTLHPAEDFFAVGDIFVTLNGVLSDVIRFNPGSLTGTLRTQTIVFYSADLGGGLLADTGLPPSFYANTLTLMENSLGVAAYTPVAGQPGFEAGSSAPITFRFFSVPETGSSLSLFGLALCGIALLRRKARLVQ
jgi:hypothetical protein